MPAASAKLQNRISESAIWASQKILDYSQKQMEKCALLPDTPACPAPAQKLPWLLSKPGLQGSHVQGISDWLHHAALSLPPAVDQDHVDSSTAPLPAY